MNPVRRAVQGREERLWGHDGRDTKGTPQLRLVGMTACYIFFTPFFSTMCWEMLLLKNISDSLVRVVMIMSEIHEENIYVRA